MAVRLLTLTSLLLATHFAPALAQSAASSQSASPANAGGQSNAGGAANADFDSLIDLITSTVDADSWMENGTGEGEIMPFPNGVYVDAAGSLRVANSPATVDLANVRSRGAANQLRKSPGRTTRDGQPAWASASPLRYVSLPRLEAAIAARQAAHRPLDPEMLTLAGLRRVSYILAYPESHDLVLAGPAGDWTPAPGGRLVAVDDQRPVVRLDDFLELMRRQRQKNSTAFGCSIVPRQANLAAAQRYLAASASRPIEPAQRREWLEGARSAVGAQDVEYYNIASDTRVARLLLEADYHMKLVGMGLAKGVPGVRSYLASVRLGPGGSAPPMTVLRWWFSMPKSTVQATDARDAFALPERCVEVLSENELLAARGERIHTGQSEDLNHDFAASFTEHYETLADKYPVYGELSRVFELALALAVIQQEGLAERVDWTPTLMVNESRLRLPAVPAPTAVDTVINHRVIGGRQIIAGVSGGVWVDGAKSMVLTPPSTDALTQTRSKRAPSTTATNGSDSSWWWD